jgi:ubiquinone/menaquinone biosynthesis C-methylase UbiE
MHACLQVDNFGGADTRIKEICMADIQSSSHRSTNDKVFSIITSKDILNKRILDIGAGRGYMAKRLGDYIRDKGGDPAHVITACDLYPEYFLYKDISCEKVEFINELPFPKESFDIVYAIEVIEHLKNPYDFIQELFRVIRPGGEIIITTPNTLNLFSRFSYLLTGFFELFKPLSFNPQDARRQWGHIMPLSAYYLDHAMKICSSSKTEIFTDRLKKSALFLFLLFFPILKISSHWYSKKIQRKEPEIYRINKEALKAMNGWKLCCSRSIILVAYK